MGYVSRCFVVLGWGLVALLAMCISVLTYFALMGILLLGLLTLVMLGWALSMGQSVDYVTQEIGIVEIGLSWKVLLWYFAAYLGLGLFFLPSLRVEDT